MKSSASLLSVLLLLSIFLSCSFTSTTAQENDFIITEETEENRQQRSAEVQSSSSSSTTLTSSEFCSSSKFPCGFHGNCISGVCKCHATPELGYWVGAVCDECFPGFAGPQCNISCQGGAWTPCNGHGICSSGTSGDGSCFCFDDNYYGHWTGDACDTCQSYYFPSSSCNETCPGVSSGAAPCHARGTCIQASAGAPAVCECEHGWDAAIGCHDCNASCFGAECSGRCTGFVAETGEPCSGHGVCSSGLRGDGTCTCHRYYGTPDCSKKCPNECSGHGSCSDGTTGTALCTCEGNFAPPDCLLCRSNVTGPNCTIPCPSDSSGMSCSGHGACAEDPAQPGIASTCNCDLGYTGSSCAIQCPGSPPCSGHGFCSIDNTPGAQPYCTCFTNSSHGFWTGDSCEKCQIEYNNSATCTAACPTNPNDNSVCSGHGYCSEGKCYCDRTANIDYCGASCNISSQPAPQIEGQPCSLCSCFYCVVPGTYGPDCGNVCPGDLKCSGNGFCDHGLNGTGKCQCNEGFTGEGCDLVCPSSGSPSRSCGGVARGTCVTTGTVRPLEGIVYSSACECKDGFAGTACEKSCPHFNGRVCSNHGTCNRTTAECECHPGWTGAKCNINCGCNSDHGKCNSAVCDQKIGNSAGTCYECECDGNFTGLCFDCKNGTQGSNCEGPCVNGTTKGRECVCDDYFSSAACDVPCPRSAQGQGQICSGHGSCDWGNDKSGVCSCQQYWYGATCNVTCSESYCRQQLNLKNSQCNPVTGQCECLNDGLAVFVGEKCDVCADNYWGPLCSEPCQCSGHGICNDFTGDCTCFASSSLGFYSGASCTKCLEGYIGDNCERRNIAFTPLARSLTSTASRNLSARVSFLWAGPDSSDLLASSGTLVGASSPVGGNIQGFTMIDNTTDACPSEVAVSWIEGGFIYAILQPCGGSLRLHKVSLAAARSTTSSPKWTQHSNWKLDLINASVVISHAMTQVVGSGADVGYVVMLIVSEPVPLSASSSSTSSGGGAGSPASPSSPDQQQGGDGGTTPSSSSSSTSTSSTASPNYQYWPGGSLIRLHIDTIVSNAAISAHIEKELPEAFTPSDLDLMFSDELFEELVVIGGRTASSWDLLVYKRQLNQLVPYISNVLGEDAASIKNQMRCFPKNIIPTDFCPECTDIARVRFTNRFGIVAAIHHSAGEPFVAWFQPDITMINGQRIYASRNGGPCELAEYDAGLQQLRSIATGFNFLPPNYVIEMARSLSPNSRITAMTVDEPGYVTYLAVQAYSNSPEGTPGVLTKYSLFHGNFSILGTLSLGFVVSGGRAIAEAVEFLVVNQVQRIVYALVADVTSFRVLSYLAYEVHSFEPDLADIRGGTNVTVRGLGFFAQSGGLAPKCRFGDELVPATIFSSRILHCFAPALLNNTAIGSCSGQPVEATLFGDTVGWTTNNEFTIQRFLAARIEGAPKPDRGSLAGQPNINITGTGFQPSDYAKCKFYSNNSLATEVLFSTLHYISPTQATCDQPPAQDASYDTSFIDVSLDGQLYSDGAPALYQIVGSATNISSPDTFDIVAVGVPDPTGNYTSIQTFQIAATIIDDQRHRLEALDTVQRTVCVDTLSSSACSLSEFSWRSLSDPYPNDPCRNNTFVIKRSLPFAPDCIVMNDGRVTFEIEVADARSGVFEIEFYTTVGLETWFSRTLLTIEEGAAYALALSNKKAIETRPLLVQGAALTPAPEIAVVDRLGNLLPKLDKLDQNFVVTAQAYYILDDDLDHKIMTNRYSLPRQDAGKIRFGQIFITSYIHGANHYVNFTSVNPTLVSALSPPLRTEPCKAGNASFKLPNSSSCLPCPPEGATCDGSELIIVQPGYWNGTTIGDIFKCPGGKTVCLGSMWGASQCAEGYEGPLCSLCTMSDKNGKMWGKAGAKSCAECPDPGIGALFLALGGLAIVIALFVWSFFILRQPEVTDLSVIFRTVVNHLQAAGNLGDFSAEMSPLLRSFLQIQESASSPSFSGLSSLDCLIRRSGQDYSALFYGYMSLPVISFFMAIFMYITVRLLKLAPVITDKLRANIEEDIKNMPSAPSAVFLREYPFYVVAITTLSVNFFTMYQTLIAQSTAVLRCTELVIMPPNGTTPVKQSYLDVDMTIECDENGSHKLRTPAYIFAILYGFGTPTVFYFGYKFFYRRVGDIEIMKLMFMFLTGGYRDQFYFWQALIMVRKMMLVVVVVFMADSGVLQNYAGMWVMSAALLLQLYFSPNEKHDHNQVEAISLAVIVATLNLGFLYPSLDSLGRILLTIALMIITIGMLIVFAYFMFEPLRNQILEVRDGVLEAIAEFTAKKDGDDDSKKIKFDEDETTFELEDVIPQMNRVRDKTYETRVLEEDHNEQAGSFQEVEDWETWSDDKIKRFIEDKREARLSKYDDML